MLSDIHKPLKPSDVDTVDMAHRLNGVLRRADIFITEFGFAFLCCLAKERVNRLEKSDSTIIDVDNEIDLQDRREVTLAHLFEDLEHLYKEQIKSSDHYFAASEDSVETGEDVNELFEKAVDLWLREPLHNSA